MPPTKIVLLNPIEDDPRAEPALHFRLTYTGELKSSQKDATGAQRDRLAEHKQSIRKKFHPQLKRLWETNRFLREHRLLSSRNDGTDRLVASNSQDFGLVSDVHQPMVDVIADQYREYGYRFVPLVREEVSLLCSLDILFLRRDIPGRIISAGDLDNRIKTLIDTLRRPRNGYELRGNETPAEGEDPFFCLLEDDKLVTQLSVETDTLLDPPTGDKDLDLRKVQIIISVDIKPYDITSFNLSFA